ncbi:MAG: tetratricopeptide repeat protein [Planctomycetales bacterium]|nr:tetratricopeptide repeat protein [Planctomycetales bacterium]MBN8625560.1 tetratricopeptide repeat protein [Planctomycetota bacterium]
MSMICYLICSSPQSGADLLAAAVKTMQGGRLGPEEYFNPLFETQWRGRFGIAKEVNLLAGILEHYAKCDQRLGAVVQRQHWNRLVSMLGSPTGSIVERLQHTFGEIRFVHIRRRNKERQAAAWYRQIVARQTNEGLASTLDLTRLTELLRLARSYDVEWTEYFRQADIRPLEIDGESLWYDWQKTLIQTCEFLGIPTDKVGNFPPPSPPPFDDLDFDWLRQLSDGRPAATSDLEVVTESLRHGGEYFGRNALAEAEHCFRRVLEYDPLSHSALHNCAATLAALGKRDEAIVLFRRAAALKPQAADTHRNLALAYSQSGRSKEAEDEFRRAVDVAPENAEMHYELAQFLRSLRRYEDAATEYERTTSLDPQHAGAFFALGICQGELKRRDEARRAYERAVAIRPEFAEAQNNLGVAYEEIGEYDKAKQAYSAALAARPGWPEALNNFGVAMAAQGDFVGAEAHYRKALEAEPNSASVLNNLGNALRSQGKLDEAVAVLRRSLELKPHYSEAYNNLGIALMNQGLPNEAIAHYNQALYFVPDYPEPHLNRSLAWLSLADFDNGWVEYEWRWRGKHFGPRNYKQPRWDGGDVSGRTVFVYAEQGLGDTLQFIRYAKLIKQRGARVVAQVQSTLLPILQSFDGVDEWIGSEVKESPQFDVHAPLLSLPGAFKTNADTIPAPIPYLAAKPELLERWRESLAKFPGFRVAVAWQGNPQYRGDRMRSPPLDHFEELAKIAGVTLISIQAKHGLDQLGKVAERFQVHTLPGLDESGGAFMDTAAVMRSVDLVIASDSALVHLAGALGVPVWVPLPLAADWRWFRAREDSPWYPTMRLFRQTRTGEWSDVFRRLADALRIRVRARRPADAINKPLVCEASSFQQGTALAKEGRLAEAEVFLRQAQEEDFDSAIVAHNLGVVLALQKKLTDAVESFRRALAIAPEYGEAHGNLGLACLELGLTDEAVLEFQAALRFGANPAAMHNNLGAAMMDAGRPRDAAAAYRQALLLNPGFAEAHLNLGRSLLALGQYREGWLEYEWRRRCGGYRVRKLNLPAWAGENLQGRPILLHDDAPAEDFFQFLRYASLIHRRGGVVSVHCPESWRPLVRYFRGVASAIGPADGPQRFAVQSTLSGLPALFQTSLETVPQEMPYLDLPSEAVDDGRTALRSEGRFTVALVRPPFDRDTQTADFQTLESLLRHDQIQLVRLPVWDDQSAASDLPVRISLPEQLSAAPATTGDLVKLAAWMKGADLVVTADGPECHLAGACGADVRLLLDTVTNWRWMRDRDDTPWYPQTKLVRRRLHEPRQVYLERVVEEILHFVSTARRTVGGDRR